MQASDAGAQFTRILIFTRIGPPDPLRAHRGAGYAGTSSGPSML